MSLKIYSPVEITLTLCKLIRTTLSQKGTPTLSTVTLERINGFWRFLAQVFPTQLAIKWLFNFPPHPTSASTLPGENRTNEFAPKWTKNVNKLEIRSHKNLITVVWANEVHRLLTYYSTSCYHTHNASLVTRSCFRRTAHQRIGAQKDQIVGAWNPGSVAPQQP